MGMTATTLSCEWQLCNIITQLCSKAAGTYGVQAANAAGRWYDSDAASLLSCAGYGTNNGTCVVCPCPQYAQQWPRAAGTGLTNFCAPLQDAVHFVGW